MSSASHETIRFSVVSLSIAAVLCALIGGSLYGCQRVNRAYYDMARDCVQHGGSFVPVGQTGSYSAICVSKGLSWRAQ